FVGLTRPAPDAIMEMFFLDPDDGTLLKTIDLAPTWIHYDEQVRGFPCNGIRHATFNNGRIYLAGIQNCLKQCVDPYTDDENELTIWTNSNGDYIGDMNFEPTKDANQKWLCGCGSAAPWNYDISADANDFVINNMYDLGAVSFALFGPDGRGAGPLAFAGETAASKYGQLFLDTGTAYDGIYMDNNQGGKVGAWLQGLWFVGHDSIKGIIGTEIGVKDEQPAAFSVAQNVPNPFNPTTTISFTLAKSGRTTVEIFNTAGQKVDTILNANLKAGSHSVTWNASRFSAGVYFYTIKTSEITKTMKMTLLR
ncbi:MAG: T9SS type A sorting domain-containing protein, partial [Candidatus Latescibacterota bacterium]